MTVLIDKRIKKSKIDNKGYGFIALNEIPVNTIILIEKPVIEISNHNTKIEMFQLLYEIFMKDKKIIQKFMNLFPIIFNHKYHQNGNILEQYKILKNVNPKLYEFFKINFNIEEILHMCSKYICNAFMFNKKPTILFQGSIFNHSCLPNVIFGEKENKIFFSTVRNIKKGEELCDNYIDIIRSKNKRQDILLKQYDFSCECERCKKDNRNKDEKAIIIEKTRLKKFGFTKSNHIKKLNFTK